MPAANQRRRRRPGIGTAVTTAIVAYGTYQLASWAWNRWVVADDGTDEEQRQRTSSRSSVSPKTPQQRRQLHRLRKQRIAKCRQDVVNALEGFLPTVRRVIEEATNVVHDKQALKELRLKARLKSRQKVKQEQEDSLLTEEAKIGHRKQEEAALWTKIQVNTLTRMIATAYSHTILFVVLTVQVHLLGGHLFRLASSSTSPNSVVADDNTDAAAASHRTVLTETYHQFLDDGLITLLEIVREAVEDAINCPEWNVLDPASALHMTRDTFQTAVDRIRNRVEESTSSQNILQRIIVPPDTNGDTTTATTEAVTGDKVALFLLEETWDLLESPVVNDAFKDCLDGTFDMMRKQHWDSILFVGEDRPLAQVIAQLKHTTNSFYRNNKGDDDGTPYCSMMESLPSVAELSDVSFN